MNAQPSWSRQVASVYQVLVQRDRQPAVSSAVGVDRAEASSSAPPECSVTKVDLKGALGYGYV